MKKWYESKTLWVNMIGLALLVTEFMADVEWIDSGIVAGVLGILNFSLRLITSKAIDTK